LLPNIMNRASAAAPRTSTVVVPIVVEPIVKQDVSPNRAKEQAAAAGATVDPAAEPDAGDGCVSPGIEPAGTV
jgi:hypothetical protein